MNALDVDNPGVLSVIAFEEVPRAVSDALIGLTLNWQFDRCST
jgi:hypothetical protein